MTQLVVHRLEAVKIEEADRQRPTVPAVQLQGVRRPVDEQGPVRDPGELVVERLVAQLGLPHRDGAGKELVLAHRQGLSEQQEEHDHDGESRLHG